LNDNLSVSASAGTSLTITGAIADTGTHSLTVNAAGATGTLILANANSYLGRHLGVCRHAAIGDRHQTAVMDQFPQPAALT